MQLLDPNGLVSLLGLLTQTVVAWILVLIFALLRRPSGRPAYFRDWTLAIAALAVGLSAISLRYMVPLSTHNGVPGFAEGAFATRLLYLVYQLGKGFFAWWLWIGATRVARGDAAAARLRWTALPVAAFAVLTAIAAGPVEEIMLYQSLLLVPACLWAGRMLWRLPDERRAEGARIVSLTLTATGVLWMVYSGNALRAELGGPAWLTRRDWLNAVLTHNSYLDVILLVTLAAGMIVLLLQELQRVSQLALAERARLELELERGERLRSLGALVSAVAHDLNNPLTAVLGFAGELERAHAGTEEGNAARIVREQAERCRSIVKRLSALVGDHPAPRRRVAPAELVRRVASGLQPRFDAAGVHLEVATGSALPEVFADPYGLEEVLDNLLDNALRAAPRGSTVRLSASADSASVCLRVRDEGPGVAPPLRARIFEPFFTTRRGEGGTGLGLAVARGIARAHSGVLVLEEAAPGARGACFALRLPAADLLGPDLPETAPAALDNPAPAAMRRALVVDDEALVRKVLRAWLRRQGWAVEEAEDGAAALDALRAHGPFDAVLCDLRMPRVTGYALHDQLAARHPQELARFVFITGDLVSAEAAAFSERCQQTIVRKPFDFQELEAALARIAAQTPAPSVRGPAVGALALFVCAALSPSCGREQGSVIAAAAPPQPGASLPAAPGEAQAAALFAQNCAACHGPTGDGNGSVRLDRPARSFRQGGFSFGNTEEAVFRTITSGIGGTPMPGFAQSLTDEQRRALARHVISLGPEQVPSAGFASVLAVGDRPVVVRGQLPALDAGGPEYTRGLMAGNPDGLSYEYRADDFMLLAVRQGPFVDRKDWGERGGLPLEPLGRVIYAASPDGAPEAEWRLPDGGPARAQLRASRTDGPAAVLRYALLDADGRECAVVQESGAAVAHAAASGFRRIFLLGGDAGAVLRAPLEFPAGARLARGGDVPKLALRLLAGKAQGRMVSAADGRIELEYLLLPDASDAAWQSLSSEVGP